MKNEQVLRRRFLLQATGFMGSIVASRTLGQEIPSIKSSDAKGNGTRSTPKARLAQSFNNAELLAVSSDGKCICLFYTRHPQETFSWLEGAWRRDEGRDANEVLRVHEVNGGKVVYSVRLREKASLASFFRGGESLYVETGAFYNGADFVSQQLVIDLQNGKKEDHFRPENPKQSFTQHRALKDRVLLGTEMSGRPRRMEALTRVELPEYSEIQRARFAVTPDRSRFGRDTDIFLSADRTTMIYGYDQEDIVCRRTDDLGVIWTHSVEPAYRFVIRRLAISANGGHVAVDQTLFHPTHINRVDVHDGRTGALLVTLPVDGSEGLAISPDGKFLAAGDIGPVVPNTGEAEQAVSIFEISSSKQVARIIHDRFEAARREYVNSSFGLIEYTSDGKYLITSGIHTKIWELNG